MQRVVQNLVDFIPGVLGAIEGLNQESGLIRFVFSEGGKPESLALGSCSCSLFKCFRVGADDLEEGILINGVYLEQGLIPGSSGSPGKHMGNILEKEFSSLPEIIVL